MLKSNEIKRMMIVHSDSDFCRVWDWIGKITLNTINSENYCGENILEDTDDIERFILSLLPTAIEFIFCRVDKYNDGDWYNDVDAAEIDRLNNHLRRVVFKYNFEDDDYDYEFGGSETVIIDLENKESYIN